MALGGPRAQRDHEMVDWRCRGPVQGWTHGPGFWWFFMGLRLDSHDFSRLFKAFQIPSNPFRSTQITLDPFRTLWIPLDPSGILRIPSDPFISLDFSLLKDITIRRKKPTIFKFPCTFYIISSKFLQISLDPSIYLWIHKDPFVMN